MELAASDGKAKAVKAINEGHLGFIIEKYHQKRYDKDCYSVEWVDL